MTQVLLSRSTRAAGPVVSHSSLHLDVRVSTCPFRFDPSQTSTSSGHTLTLCGEVGDPLRLGVKGVNV